MDHSQSRLCGIHPRMDDLRLLNTEEILVLTIWQYELPGMKTRGGQSIVRARGHAMTQVGARGDAGRRRGSWETRRRRQSKRENFCSILRVAGTSFLIERVVTRSGSASTTSHNTALLPFWECYFGNYRFHDIKEEELYAGRAAARSPQ